jgi:uncharacterized protein (DUF58 family)
MPPRSSRLARYLDPAAVARIAAVGFQPSNRVEGRRVGNHRSPFHGFAVEFAGHRQYVPGDDPRHIDWKVYYKSGRYTTKLYELETNFVAHLVVDVSESMKFAYKTGRKSDYAAFMAVALAHAVVAQSDQAAVTFFADEALETFPPSSADEVPDKISKYMEDPPFKDRTAVGRVLSLLAERIGRRKVVFVLSDFFGDVAATFDGVKRLADGANEVILLHLVDPLEIDFSYPGRVELIELEGTRRDTFEGRDIRASYNELFAEYLARMRGESRRHNVDYVLCDTGANFGLTLAKYLNTRLLGQGGRT